MMKFRTRTNKKIENIARVLLALLVLIMSLATTGCSVNSDGSIKLGAGAAHIEEVSSDENSADFELRMLDVGQGLAVLIKADDKYMLYDGGGRYTSSYVVSYLKKHNVSELDYMIASHYDEDHIFGLVGVLNTTKVGTALTPDYTTDTKVYTSFRSMLAKNGANEIHPELGDSYRLGGATIQVLGPESYAYGDDNDKSIAVRISYGDFSVIITGDQSTDGETDIIQNNRHIQSTLYIVGHHGSSHSSSTALLNKVAAEYALISVGSDNSYGHPTADTLKRLKDANCKIYRTDLNGEINVFYDGEKLWFETEREASEDELATDGSAGSNGSTNSDADSYSNNSYSSNNSSSNSNSSKTNYVLNTSTRKFHYPDCYSVSKMAEHNKKYSESTREELINQGYSPCGNCKP